MLVRSRMTATVLTVTPTTTLVEALGVTRTHAIRHLPVLENGRLAGILSDRDLRLATPPAWAADHDELLAALNEKTAADVMVTEVLTIHPDTPVEDAARLMYTHRIGCLPVVEDGTLVGIITETDMLRAVTEIFGAHLPSSRLEVQMPNRAGELARVVRLIGIELKINIAGMVVPPLKDGEENVAILHVETEDPAYVVFALRKMGYRVGTPSLDTDPHVDEPPGDEFAPRGAHARTAVRL